METIGNDSGLGCSARFLNRVISFTSQGIEFEADQRLVEALVNDLGLTGSKATTTPGTKPRPIAKADHQQMMERRLGAGGGADCIIANLKAEVGQLRSEIERLSGKPCGEGEQGRR